MKEGLEGLSPLPTGPTPSPLGLWKTQGPLSLGAPGLALLGDWPPGRGPVWAKLCVLEKKFSPPSLGGSRDLGLGGRGWGEVPPLQSPSSPQGGGQTQPLLLGCLQHVWRAGETPETAGKEGVGPSWRRGSPCPAGREWGG